MKKTPKSKPVNYLSLCELVSQEFLAQEQNVAAVEKRIYDYIQLTEFRYHQLQKTVNLLEKISDDMRHTKASIDSIMNMIKTKPKPKRRETNVTKRH